MQSPSYKKFDVNTIFAQPCFQTFFSDQLAKTWQNKLSAFYLKCSECAKFPAIKNWKSMQYLLNHVSRHTFVNQFDTSCTMVGKDLEK